MPIIYDKALQSLPGSLVLHHPLTALHLVRNSFPRRWSCNQPPQARSLWVSFNWLNPLVDLQEFTDSTLIWDLSQPPSSLSPSMVRVWTEHRGIRVEGMWQKRLFLSWLSSVLCYISCSGLSWLLLVGVQGTGPTSVN